MNRTADRAIGQADYPKVLGVPIFTGSMQEALARITELIESGDSHLVVTADSSGLAQSDQDEDLRQLYQDASLATPDSIGVTWALKRQGITQERISGVELVDQICRLSADRGWRIYFLGAAHGIAERAAEHLRLKHPGCNIVGTRHGFFTPDDDTLVAQEIAKAKPDVLFVAMGIPRQEKFIMATKEVISAGVGIGVGGSFDVYSGTVKRAPKLVQALKLEWLWRTLLNPKKIAKAKWLPKFAQLVMREGRRKAGQG